MRSIINDWGRARKRVMINILVDGIVSALMTPLARWLADPQGGVFHPLWFVVGGAMTLLVSGVLFRIPQQYWRYSGILDLRNIIAAASVSACLLTLLLWVTGYGLPTPAFPFIDAIMLIMGLGGARLGARLLESSSRSVTDGRIEQRALLIGTPEHLDNLIRLIQKGQINRHIVGLVTPEPMSQGQRIHGNVILGDLAHIKTIIDPLLRETTHPLHVIIADPDMRGAQLMALLSALEHTDVPVLRMPSLDQFHPAGRVELQPIVLEDLLNRTPIRLSALMEEAILHLITGHTVLVTGAGGSIGTELVRQIAYFSPSYLLLLEHNEYALWRVELMISEHFPDLHVEAVIGDVRDREAMNRLFERYHPHYVFHAAAMKHVPLVERNVCEAILTNVIGTRIIAECACCYQARAFVMISTDKAVYPSSVMGATKRCAERYTHARDEGRRHHHGGTCCLTVRFGNVLGSTGSVVPLFRHQLAHGGPLTITDPAMTRYFMTISEAVGLVLQAMQRRLHHGAASSLFVLDMGKPVKIIELARQMIRLAGLRPDHDIAIHITGRREGEKLEEELFYDHEQPQMTDHDGLWEVPFSSPSLGEMTAQLHALEALCRTGDTQQALEMLKQLVPEFSLGRDSQERSQSSEHNVSHKDRGVLQT